MFATWRCGWLARHPGACLTNMKLLSLDLSSGCQWRQLDLTTEIIDSSDEALDRLVAVAASEVPGAEVVVFGSIFKHMVGGGEH
jgi:hypothetical protein